MNNTQPKHIIVVLGMHRSGTSAITRGLEVIGVNLGDHLMPPGPDNQKGYWEDLDINALNIALLEALGHDWHTLIPVHAEEFTLPAVAEFKLRAVEVLRNKLSGTDCFGLKDPRIPRLLPFWQSVFAHLQARVSYVIACRNPLSVARSLATRNGFDVEKGYYLWLEHMLLSLMQTTGQTRIVVDYDRLMEDPGGQLQRMARSLGLVFDPRKPEFAEYQNQFLEDSLRHIRYRIEDLHQDRIVPPSVATLYKALVELASDIIHFDHPEVMALMERTSAQFRENYSALRYMQACEDRSSVLACQLAERDERLTELGRTVTELEDRIGAILWAVSDNEEERRSLTSVVQAVIERNQKIAELEETIQERDAHIALLSDSLSKLDMQITSLQRGVSERDGVIAALHNSTSWRITAPLRLLKDGLRVRSERLSGRSAWLRFLITRSIYVIRFHGLGAFLSKAFRYSAALWRCRKASTGHTLNFVTKGLMSDKGTDLKPLVSFVIPIYDRTDVLRMAIHSALNQTVKDLEVILVTDGSPPETIGVVNEFRDDPRVRIFSFPFSSGNAVRGRNKGILEARGEYIAFLDSDDIADPRRLEFSLPILTSGAADVVYGAWRALLDGTRSIPGIVDGQIIYSPDCDLELLKSTCVPCQSTVMVRRELFFRAGFLKSSMQYREDHELWVRLAHFGASFKSIRSKLTDLRLHAGNNEINFKNNDEYWEKKVKDEYTIKGQIPKKIVFVVGGLGISGGLNVCISHAQALMSAGHDVSIFNVGEESSTPHWLRQCQVPIYSVRTAPSYFFDNLDLLFATFWTTVEWLDRLSAKRKLYFVQSDERLFYDDNALRKTVERTYRREFEYVVISDWLRALLQKEFEKMSFVVPNGLDTKIFCPQTPLVPKGQRVRVLIEGPLDIPFKGVADAYEAVAPLDCEIWIASSGGKVSGSWRCDKFFDSVPWENMPRIYSSCDILLKMSRVESFSYPVIEAMACGCAVVVGKVDGGIEYLNDGVNALVVEKGDVLGARRAVQRLMDDVVLREQLIQEGLKTSRNWSIENSHNAMLNVVNMC